MTKNSDIAIIGGGVIGLSLARALGARGASVMVFDAGDAIPPATSAAAGMLTPSFEHGNDHHCIGGETGERIYHFGARALSLWPDFAAALEEESGVSCDYRGGGALGIAFTEEEAASLAEQCESVRRLGGDAGMISVHEAHELEPFISKDISAALYAPNDAQVDPRRLLIALRATVKKNANRHVAEKVVRMKSDDASVSITVASDAQYTVCQAVLAGGAVSGLASSSLVFPVKGDALALAVEDGAIQRVVRSPGAYLCPKEHGRLVIGATEEHGRDDQTINDAAVEQLKANAIFAAPVLSKAEELERWTGLRPGTPDGAPVMGRAGENIFLALGHYRNGILHAPACARDMAALMLDGTVSEDLKCFNPSRFGDGVRPDA